MSNLTRNLIDAIISGKATDIETSFQATMAEKIASNMADKKVEVAQSMFTKESTQYESGDWHVTDNLNGGIHSTHSTPRKAKNMAEKLNAKDYDENKEDESRSSGNIFHNRYGTQAASDYDKKGMCKESIEELDGSLIDARLKAQEAKATAQKLTAHASAFPRDAKAGDASRRAWKDHEKANSHLASMELAYKNNKE